MELSGLQIFKYLPGGKKAENTNCKKCKQLTCMTFALKLAKNKVDINDCPFASDELKKIIEQSTKIQQYIIEFENGLKIGGETVMFRHEKTFVNKAAIMISLNCEDENFDKKLNEIINYEIERVGEIFKIDGIYLEGEKNFENAASKIKKSGLALISDKTSNLFKAKTFEEIENNSGAKDLIVEFSTQKKSVFQIINEMTKIRYLAIRKRRNRYTHPILTRVDCEDIFKATTLCSLLICRYANIIVLNKFEKSMLSAIFTLRQNIYTDPEKPLQVEAGVYEINEPDKNAIVVMTTNFALTYFAVRNEIEPLNIPCYLVITPSDGMSVLTAWSAEKFTTQMVAKVFKNDKNLKNIKNKEIIIPGLLSHMKEELSEALPDWKIIIGTVEAYKLPEFLKSR